MRTIRTQLLLGLLLGIFAAIAMALAGSFLIAQTQAGHAFDFHLQQIAETAPDHIHVGSSPRVLDAEEFILLQIWDADDNVLYASRSNMLVPRQHNQGFQNVNALGKSWRVFVELRDGHTIQVSQLMSERDELTAQLAVSAVLPVIALVPLLALLVSFVVNRSLKPLHAFADKIAQRDPNALQPIDLPRAPQEVLPVMRSINGLIARLRQALDAQKAFIADAAHELRTPLTALRLQMQLTEKAQTPEARQQAFGKLYTRLERAEHLVAQLLSLARQDVARMPEKIEAVDLCALAKMAVAEFSLSAESRNIDLGFACDLERLAVEGVGTDLQVLLHCLIDNAVRYSPPGGRVDVRVGLRNGCPMLAVVDEGPGIPASERERIFSRFYRGENAADIGSGLGLAIAQRIAQAHGASLQIEDNDSGVGIRLVLLFPPRN